MSDIELVIKVPKTVYNALTHTEFDANLVVVEMRKAITDGTPLPEGHGDLIDVNRKITVPVYDEQYEEWGEKTLTVREALDKWSDEGVTAKDVVISEVLGQELYDEDKDVLEQLAEEQNNLLTSTKAWSDAIEKNGYVN